MVLLVWKTLRFMADYGKQKHSKAVESILNEQLSETYTSQWSMPAKTTHKQKVLKETTDERGILLRERR